MNSDLNQPLLEVEHLKKTFSISKGFLAHGHSTLKAVDDVGFALQKGETLGLVGESGCGKTTIGRTLIRLYEADEGKILFQGRNIMELSDLRLTPKTIGNESMV